MSLSRQSASEAHAGPAHRFIRSSGFGSPPVSRVSHNSQQRARSSSGEGRRVPGQAPRGRVVAGLGDRLTSTRAELVVIGGMPYAVGAAFPEGASLRGTLLAGAAGAVLQAACGLINSVVDRHSDATHPRKLDLPLVTGRIQPRPALVVAAFGLLAYLSLVLAAAPAGGTVAALVVVGIVQVYVNVQQKRSRLVPPPVMDLLFGSTFGLSMLAFALGTLGTSRALTMLAFVVTLDAVALNVLAGNIKDLRWDALVGDRTTALVLGVTAEAGSEPTTLLLTRSYRRVAIALLTLRTMALAVAAVPEQPVVGAAAVAMSLFGMELWRRATQDGRLVLAHPRPFAFVATDLTTFLVACATMRPTTSMAVAILVTIALAPVMAAITRACAPAGSTTN